MTRIDGDRAAADPSIISDSAVIAITADRRLVWVKGKGSDMLTAQERLRAEH